MFCKKCGTKNEGGARFCAKCGTPVEGVAAPKPVPAASAYHPVAHTPKARPATKIRPVPLVALILCVILWLAAPFMAINLLTMGEPPTALQLLTSDDLMFIGEIAETPAFWAAVVSIISIALCLLFVVAKRRIAPRIFAILASLVLIIAVLMMSDFELTETIGFGYVGIFILLMAVCFTAGKKEKPISQMQQSTPSAPMMQQSNAAMPQPMQPPPAPAQAPPQQPVPISNNTCTACGKVLGEEEWKCPACGAFRE